jgi:hypothetical protein
MGDSVQADAADRARSRAFRKRRMVRLRWALVVGEVAGFQGRHAAKLASERSRARKKDFIVLSGRWVDGF